VAIEMSRHIIPENTHSSHKYKQMNCDNPQSLAYYFNKVSLNDENITYRQKKIRIGLHVFGYSDVSLRTIKNKLAKYTQKFKNHSIHIVTNKTYEIDMVKQFNHFKIEIVKASYMDIINNTDMSIMIISKDNFKFETIRDAIIHKKIDNVIQKVNQDILFIQV
jgi:hypothetical protein